ncbi:MAG: ABC transporter ATP-binding protein [Myxococcales bacterium]|nr:MAG: ABC transporter ATP-binding protein [Myxococcales bacterium]
MEAVSFRYSNAAELALSDISLRLRAGELLGVLGPNGSGKSTLLGLCSGQLKVASGNIRIGSKLSTEFSRIELARSVAVVEAKESIAFGFRVIEVVAMGRAPHLGLLSLERPSDRAVVHQAMQECDLLHLQDRAVSTLSAGEQKRVSIARALTQQTQVLLLDEPTAFLDVHHQIALLDLLRRRIEQKKLAALVVLHDLNLAAQYCDRLLLLRRGKQVAQGAVEEVMTYRRIRDTFDCEVYVGFNEINQKRYFVPMRSESAVDLGENFGGAHADRIRQAP